MKKGQCQYFVIIVFYIFGETAAADPQPIMFPGQVNIALLTDLHETKGNNNTQCQVPRIRSLDLATAAVWAVNHVNLHRGPQEARIGLYVYDTCGRHDVAQRQLYRLLNHVAPGPPFGCGEQQTAPVFGIISQSEKNTTEILAKILEAFSIPLILTSGGWSSNFNSGGNVFSTAPSLTSLARAVVQTLNFVKVKRVALVQFKALTAPSRVFQSEAESQGIHVAMVIHLPNDEVTPSSISSLKKGLPHYVQAMVFFVNGSYVEAITRNTDSSVSNVMWIFATTSEFDFERNTPNMHFSPQVYVVCPQSRNILESHLTHHEQHVKTADVPEKGSFPIDINYYLTGGGPTSYGGGEIHHKVKHPLSEVTTTYIRNVGEGSHWVEEGTREEKVATANAVWILAEAARFVQKSAFWNPGRCLLPEPRTLASDVLSHLPSLNVTFGGQSLIFGEDRRLASLRYTVMSASNSTSRWIQVATYSDLESFVQTPQTTTSVPTEDESPTDSVRRSVTAQTAEDSEGGEILSTAKPPGSFTNFTSDVKLSIWVPRPWAIAVLSLSTVGILLCIYAFVYLLLKMCDFTLKPGEHFLAFLHLLTLIGMYSSAAVLTFRHTALVCILRRVAQNLAYVSCFGCLLLKATHLQAKPPFFGFGSRISHLSQLLMLLFIIGIQVALDVQWAMASPTCSTSTSQFFTSQIYVTVLLAVALVASVCTLRPAASGFEAHCLVATTFTSGIVLGTRAAVYYVIHDPQSRDIILSFSLVITATLAYVGVCAPLAYSLRTRESEFQGCEEDSLSSRARFSRGGGGSSRRSSRQRHLPTEAYFNEGFAVARPSIFATTLPIYVAESAQL